MSRDNIQINVRERALQKFIDEIIHSGAEYEKFLVKTVMLMNGGAAAALLAFIASVWEAGLKTEILLLLTFALISLTAGIIFAGRSVLHKFTSSNSFITELLNIEDKKFFGKTKRELTSHFDKTALQDIRWSFRLFALGVILAMLTFISHLVIISSDSISVLPARHFFSILTKTGPLGMFTT